MKKMTVAMLAFAAGLLAGSASAAMTHTAATIDTRADLLAEWLQENNVPAVPSIDDESHLGLTLTNNIPDGLTLPTDLGDFTIDLNGWSIKGPDGADGSGSTAGGNGGAAITISRESGLGWGDTAITVVDERIGVQLWENGPYFATCNVGATSPEESGYYFWWGDTNGYMKVGSQWKNARTGETGFRFIGDNCSTFEKKEQFLRDEGWIDESGNLTPEHDAATAYLGAGWRMPTSAELTALIGCEKVWTNNWNETGVSGFVVSGVNESIFLPATGYVEDTTVMTSANLYWTSTPQTGDASGTHVLRFLSDGYFQPGNQARMFGLAVRAVRDSDSLHPAPGPGPAEIIGGNGGNGNPAGKGALPIVDADGNLLEVTLEIEPESVRPGEDGAFIKSKVQEELESIFDSETTGTTVEPVYDEEGHLVSHTVTLGEDYGPVAFSNDFGNVTIDLNGWSIKGPDGKNGDTRTRGENGGAAITVDGACGAEAGDTAITLTCPSVATVYTDADGFDTTPEGTASSTTYVPGDYCIIDLATGDTEIWRNVTDPTIFNVDEYKTTKMVFRYVPDGKFKAKTSEWTTDPYSKVSSYDMELSAYWIGLFELTEAQYNMLKGTPGTGSKKAKVAADKGVLNNTIIGTGVGFAENRDLTGTYLEALNNKIAASEFANKVDVCTQCQWERAARAGTRSDCFFSEEPCTSTTVANEVKAYGWFKFSTYSDYGGSGKTEIQEVGLLLPNAWGLWDVYGNAADICIDTGYTSELKDLPKDWVDTGSYTYRVARGGYIMSESAKSLSSVVRSRPSSGNLGCRLVLNAESPAVRCEVIGGNGGDGNPAGKGFPAIAYADGTELVPTVIGDNINVIHGIDGKDLHEDSGAFWVDGSVFIRAVDPAAGGKWAITFSLTLKEGAPAFDTWVNDTANAGKFKLKVAATADDLGKASASTIDVGNVRSATEGRVTFDCAIERAQLKYFKVVIED